MTNNRETDHDKAQGGYQPNLATIIEGYQPQAALPPKLTPPRTGTAIQPAQTTYRKAVRAEQLITRQIEATDREIDRLVYDLCGISDDEIRIVEEATS